MCPRADHRTAPLAAKPAISRRLGRRAVAFACLLALWLPALSLPAAAAPGVSDIRLGVHPDKTRLVLDVSQDVETRVFGLPDPYRLVIDLPEVDFALPDGQGSNGAGLVRGYRYGLFRPGVSRVVLDLGTPIAVAKRFTLPGRDGKPWRVVIDLTPASRAHFIATVAAGGPAARAVRPAPPLKTAPERPANALPVVVIDPGHGGVDPGAIGVTGVYEKTLALQYGRELHKALKATGRYKVVTTRERDVFLPLRERVRVAREADADLFISLHANTAPGGKVKGFSVYTLSDKASDAEAAALAAKENKADVIAGMDLNGYSDEVASILIDFARSRTNEMSVRFARDHLLRQVRADAELLNRPWRSAGFAVLKAPDVPSVLVEIGYMSNRREERLLQQPAHRARLTRAIARAVDNFFEQTRHASRL